MFVLDTNTLIYFFKGQGGVAGHLLATPPRDIGIPTIVLYELLVGIAKSAAPEKRTRQLRDFTSLARLLPFGPAEAEQAASLRAALEGVGTPIGPLDTLIAATALTHQASLVTHNTREFQRISQLTLVDWY